MSARSERWAACPMGFETAELFEPGARAVFELTTRVDALLTVTDLRLREWKAGELMAPELRFLSPRELRRKPELAELARMRWADTCRVASATTVELVGVKRGAGDWRDVELQRPGLDFIERKAFGLDAIEHMSALAPFADVLQVARGDMVRLVLRVNERLALVASRPPFTLGGLVMLEGDVPFGDAVEQEQGQAFAEPPRPRPSWSQPKRTRR